MKKETAIAIFFGIAFGIVVAIIMIVKTKGSLIQSTKPVLTTTTVTPTIKLQAKTQVQSLELSEPDNGTITNTNSITIKGKASKDAVIVLQSPITTNIIKSTSDTFSTTFPLALGENVIHISLYPADKQASVSERDLKIYYLSEQ